MIKYNLKNARFFTENNIHSDTSVYYTRICSISIVYEKNILAKKRRCL